MKTNSYKLSDIVFITKSLFFFIMLNLFSAHSVQAEILSIKGNNVSFRTGPGKNYSVKWEYGDGFPVELIERKGNWVKIKDFENDSGWVHKSFLVNQPQTIVKANRNKDEGINIRSGPSSDSKIVGMAYYGVVFKILDHQSGWVKVQHESGLIGWISSNLLWGF